MCTLSLITGNNQYLLGMNRDEKLARDEAALPSASTSGATRLLCPRDVEGGTWVAVNEFGNAFGLLNWHVAGEASPAGEKLRSRGHVIPHASSYRTAGQLELSWHAELFQGMRPFRLVGVFPEEQRLLEWRWDMRTLETLNFGWEPRHWFSSGLSDEQAAEQRDEICRAAWQEADAGSQDWLRRLHRAHGTAPGPFSVCVHRQDVRTLSYTEIERSPARLRMAYLEGGPCTASRWLESTL